MPIEIHHAAPSEDAEQFTEDVLFNPEGKLTMEAETLASFLDTIDFSPLFDDPDVRPFVEDVVENVKEDAGRIIECDEGDEGEGQLEFETLDGNIAVEFIDEDDLAGMLKHYIRDEYPNESLTDRTVRSVFRDLTEAEDEDDDRLEERKPPFKKGDFRRGPMTKVSGASKGNARKVHNQRVRMMVAMMKKGVIKRVKKGTGYKQGDYSKASGYGAGTAGGIRRYDTMSGKNSRRAGQIRKLVDPGRRRVVQVIYKNLGKTMPKSWVPPEKRGKMAGVVKKVGIKTGGNKAAAVAKGKALFGAKGKKIQVAHDTSAVSTLSESAASVLRLMAPKKQKPLTEETTAAK